MRIYLTAAVLLGLLAGCSSDQGPSGNKTSAAASGALQGKAVLPFAARSTISSFASLPDRGELLAYEQGRKTKHSGAYTAYPISISEAHALHAIQSGEMVVKAPNGELIRLKYKSHVESPDGNWSWIGTNADGVDAILTFGEKAVFGTIPQGKTDTLRLTMNVGQSWLVQTDRTKLAGLDGASRRQGSDQFIPPKVAAGSRAASAASMRAEPLTANAAASTAVVDVLLGYTNGFATQLGGASQAVTRLNNLMAITNQAYLNSGINLRVRLVGTLQVNYADNTDNGDALEKLTGYSSGGGGGSIPPDPAFNALRAKRDELGADLVSLVRPFRTPENNGCGIAWLIGGDQSGISAGDAPFGYSVVSDGDDHDEGDDHDYFCRDETLAHEMGHNMGQAHNVEDSDSSGVHAYSYGYRESSTDGFYTVMAYPLTDGNQFGIAYFANPAVKYSNRVTGVANASDNVRSMNQTMPIVATFRATIVPTGIYVRNDVDGNGASDLLWQNPGIRQFAFWRMTSASIASTKTFTDITSGYTIAATGDFNHDGRADVVWNNASQRQLYIWFATVSGGFNAKYVSSYPAGWNIVGAGDVDADGKSDILWQNVGAKQFAYWRMNGDQVAGTKTFMDITPGYLVAAIGDFNGDGRVDVLWGNASQRQLYIWFATATGGFSSKYVSSYPAGWSVVGAGDVTGDGRADIFWQNVGAGQFAYWSMNGAAHIGSRTFSATSGYVVAATGDYNGDGLIDLLWGNASQRQLYIWFAASGGYTSSYVSSYPAGWQVFH